MSTPVPSLLFIAGLGVMAAAGCSKSSAQALPGPGASAGVAGITTVERRFVPLPVPATAPRLLPNQVELYAPYGYGAWGTVAGQGLQRRLDLMPPGWSRPPAVWVCSRSPSPKPPHR